MRLNVIQAKLESYHSRSKSEEENAFKEICQEIALAGLARKNFFASAAFQGGTCLRIVHGLERFSEDLDFILMTPKHGFQWEPFLLSIAKEFASFGLSLEATERSKVPNPVKKAFLKEGSFGQVLELRYPRSRSDAKKIFIKLEIDTNPAAGSDFETHFLSFPSSFSIATQTPESLFAGKCHALLCRQYEKGRDWFDFLWYVQQKTVPNKQHLKNALEQCGPYQGEKIPISHEWILHELENKVRLVDWPVVVKDVEKFVSPEQQESLRLWDADFFRYHCKRLAKTMGV